MHVATQKSKSPFKKALRMKIIDLTAPEHEIPDALNLTPPPAAAKRSHSKTREPQGPVEIVIPKLASIKTQFEERDALCKHLYTLPTPILVEMLLAQDTAFEAQSNGPSRSLKHCVYCHQVYDPAADGGDCIVEHFGQFLDVYEDTMGWTCCGKEIGGYEDYLAQDWLQPPDEREPEDQYCWAGKHNEREIQDGDEDDDDDDDSDAGAKWWQGWTTSGQTCADLHCHDNPDGGHYKKRTKI